MAGLLVARRWQPVGTSTAVGVLSYQQESQMSIATDPSGVSFVSSLECLLLAKAINV
jgi:hypothetical protein